EYAEWLPEANDVEEYDTSDDVDFDKHYEISIELIVKPDGNEKLRTRVTKMEGAGICGRDLYRDTNGLHIYLHRYIPAQNFNEEFHTKKYTKAAYDILTIVKQKLSEGLSDKEINELLQGE
ncbi:MAG: hypothetical protein RSD67_08185, partial [Oscillospiraceae bacterium]